MKLLISVCLLAAVVIIWLPDKHLLTNRIKHPGYSWCHRCYRTWDVVSGHSTPYDDVVWRVTTPNDPDFPVSVGGLQNNGETHMVTVTNGVSCFPLCEECWQALTPKTRLPYYRQLVNERKKWDTATSKAEDTWPRMKAAVEAGL